MIIYRMNKKRLFAFKSVINLEIENIISNEEQKQLKGGIKMSPSEKEILLKAIEDAHKKTNFELEQDARYKGKLEGIKEGKKETIRQFKGLISDEEIAKRTGLSLKEVQQI